MSIRREATPGWGAGRRVGGGLGNDSPPLNKKQGFDVESATLTVQIRTRGGENRPAGNSALKPTIDAGREGSRDGNSGQT